MTKKGLGWVPDYPDVRDYNLNSKQIKGVGKTSIQFNAERDRTNDRIKQLATALAAVKDLDAEVQQELAALSQQIQAETEQQLSFRCADWAREVLALGSTGRAVGALQEKLKTLNYLPRHYRCKDLYYDRETQAAIEFFQFHQKLEVTGIASAVTLAKIAALSAIATQAKNPYLSYGDRGPGVTFLQQQLLTLKQIDQIDADELNKAEFGETTCQAVKAFQKKELLIDDGIVGRKTGEKLKAQFNPDLLRYFTAPIALTHFEQMSELVLALLIEEKTVPETENILDPALHPIVEVMAQLIPFLQGYNQHAVIQFIQQLDQQTEQSEIADYEELRTALSLSYQVVKEHLLQQVTAQASSLERLKTLAMSLSKRRSYFSSRALDDRDPRLGELGSAIIYLQERLRDLGCYDAPTTGYFEQLTQTAVEKFQRSFDQLQDSFDELKQASSLREKLLQFDTETLVSLNAPIPEQFFKLTCEQLNLRSTPPTDPEQAEPEVRSLVTLLAQMIMPVGKQSDLEQALKNSFESLSAIAHYSLIQQATQQVWNLLEQEQLNVNRDGDFWWKTFRSLTNSKLARRITQVRNNPMLLGRFQASIVAAIRSFSPNHAILEAIYQPFQAEVDNLWQTAIAAPSLISPYASPVQRTIEQIQILVKKTLLQPTALAVVNPQQAQAPTFLRIDHRAGETGRLQLPVQGKLNQDLNAARSNCLYLELPDAVDLSFWCSPIEDQGNLNACTAHAGVSLIEYFERKSFGQHIDGSRRFLYKTARNLMHREGDAGASIRETIKAMVLFGVPPEEYCSYDEADFDAEPASFCYAYAQNYQAIQYFRLDDSQLQLQELLAQIKVVLVAGFPCLFGFTIYDSINNPSNLKGHIPYPAPDHKREGGHAVVAVGYDDYQQVKNASPGAFLIRNSWGTGWGDHGYGWLPYDYVLNGLARDWWSLIKAEWVETGSFGLGSGFDPNQIGGSGSGGKGNRTISG